MNYRASRVLNVTLDSNQTVVEGQTIVVFGILIANSTNQAAEITIQDGEGDNTIVLTVPAQDSREIRTEFVAHKGLVFTTIGNANVYATIFHSQVGA